jgi:predicted transposase YbfD/YdcC
VREHVEHDKGHGRHETRHIEVTSNLEGFVDWPGARQFAKITRTRTIRGKRTRDVEILVMSLSADRASPADLLRFRRGHWGVENRLFCVRDVSFREDQCRVRKGSGPQALAALRNAATTALRRLGVANIASGLRRMMMNCREAVSLVRYGRIE